MKKIKLKANSYKLKAKIVVIFGPSGSGQDAVIEGLCKIIQANRVITTVTRKIRKGEKQGRPYYFISIKKFQDLLKKNAFIEWAHVYGDYRGCEKKEIHRLLRQKKTIIWKVDWQGAKTVKKIFPHAIVFFIKPPSLKILKDRLKKRGLDSPDMIQDRWRAIKENIDNAKYDYAIVNKEGKLNETIDKILQIINYYK